MISHDYTKLIHFLQEELSVPANTINAALKLCQDNSAPLPMVLWQQGVLSLRQLEKTFDWMEMA